MIYDDYTNYYDMVTFLETRLSSYIAPVYPHPPDGVPAATYRNVPFAFGNRFPALATRLDARSGRPASADAPVWAPGRIEGFVRLYAPSISVPGQGNYDARFEASEVTRKIFSDWMDAFLGDIWLEDRVGYLEILSNTEGDVDRMPAPLMEERREGQDRRILWVNESRILLLFKY